MSEWQFKGQNPDTGRKYWEKKKNKKRKEEPMKKENELGQEMTAEDRGNYNADIVADAMEEREEQKEKVVRKAMGLPKED